MDRKIVKRKFDIICRDCRLGLSDTALHLLRCLSFSIEKSWEITLTLRKEIGRLSEDKFDAVILQFGGLSSISAFNFRCDLQISLFICAFGYHCVIRPCSELHVLTPAVIL